MVESQLIDAIGHRLSSHGFRPHQRSSMEKLGCIAFWRRMTLNTNRAVAVLQAPSDLADAGRYCQKMKWRLMQMTLFCPLLYEVGLQVVLCGSGLAGAVRSTRELQKYVDVVSNQLVTLQSLFVVDVAARWYAPARTWGQVSSGPFQDAILAGIQAAGYTYFETL